MEWQDLIKLLFAAIAGAVIGFERELHDKPAGFRTMILIAVGAALFTILSIHMVGDSDVADRTRIAAQIVTGVGFLGAGAILHARGGVVGLTTAATIWAVASVGMAFGSGQYLLGILATVLVTAVLFGLSSAIESLEYRRTTAQFEIRLPHSQEDVEAIRKTIHNSGLLCRSLRVAKEPKHFEIKTTVSGPVHKIDRLQETLLQNERIIAFERV
jgi:putative Mg2+ transporter-C (MgtC) family protein